MVGVNSTQTLTPSGSNVSFGMGVTETTPFEREELRQIYDLIARQEGVAVGTLREADIDVDPDDVPEYVEALTDAGYLEERDGQLHLAVPTDPTRSAGEGDAEFEVRVARQADLSELKNVIEEVAAERTDIEAETIGEELDRDESLVRFDEETSRMFFVGVVEGEIVGWLHIEAPERNKLKHTAQFTLGVIDDYRREGIGKRLMTTGLEWAEAHGYHKVYNDFPATNRAALAFLDSLDYDAHCEAVHRDHYLIDGEFVDLMSLAVYLHDAPGRLTHFDRVQQEAEELYTS